MRESITSTVTVIRPPVIVIGLSQSTKQNIMNDALGLGGGTLAGPLQGEVRVRIAVVVHALEARGAKNLDNNS